MVRCVHSVGIDELVRDVLNKQWKFRMPKIVVTILSNAGPINNWKNKQQIKAFQKGLMNVIISQLVNYSIIIETYVFIERPPKTPICG